MISTARSSALGLAPSQLNVTASQPTADTIRVQVNYGFPLVTPIIPDVVGGGMLPLQSTTINTGY